MVEALYRSLGLEPSASIEEIKKAYRNLAKEYHPDKNKDGAEKFKEISHAYSILTDPEKKREYISKLEQENPTSSGTRFSSFYHNPFDFFNFSFSSQQYEEPRPRPHKKRAEDYDIRVTTEVSLEEIYNGSAIRISYKESMECKVCHGNPKQSSLKRTDTCRHCNGKGMKNRNVNHKQAGNVKCSFCHGKGGRSYYSVCSECHNEPYVNRKITVKLPKGVHDGQGLQLKNRGGLMPDKKTRGSLTVLLEERPHEFFSRQGDNLFITVTVSLKEAIMGFRNKPLCSHLDGRIITATQPVGFVIKPNSKRLIKGEGMPIYGSKTDAKGDLLVTFNVEFPDKIQIPETKEAKMAVDSLFETAEEREAKENAIVIDDEEEKAEETEDKAKSIIEDDSSVKKSAITIQDDQLEENGTSSNSEEKILEEVPQEYYQVSDGDETDYEGMSEASDDGFGIEIPNIFGFF